MHHLRRRLQTILYNQFGALAVDIPTNKHTATPMVSLADIKKVLAEPFDENSQ